MCSLVRRVVGNTGERAHDRYGECERRPGCLRLRARRCRARAAGTGAGGAPRDGGDGATFSRDLLAAADANNWVVVAPTFAYRDYPDPALVRADDATFLPQLAAILDGLPARTGLALRRRAPLYGFPRGAQTAQRFATVYPERVLAVAAFSAADYTLPTAVAPGDGRPLPFPYGVADQRALYGHPFDLAALRGVPFPIGVGGLDMNPADVPRAWDPLLGLTRVERAQRYVLALQAAGVSATLKIDPASAHAVGMATRDAAVTFLAHSEPASAAR